MAPQTIMLAPTLIALSLFQAPGTGATIKIHRELPTEHRSIVGLELEVSSRNQALQQLGTTEAWKRKDEHHDSFLYCYQLAYSKPAWLIIGFGWSYSFETLDSILVTTNPKDIEGPCLPINLDAALLSTRGGLRLGLDETILSSLFQENPQYMKGKLVFDYESYEKYPEPKTFATSTISYIGEYHYGRIEIGLTKKRIARFEIWIGGEPNW